MASAAKSTGGKRDEAEPAEAPPAKAAKGGNRGMLLMMLGCGLLSAAIASGATWFLAPKHAAPAHVAEDGKEAAEGDAKKDAPEQPAVYLDLTPAFVVNLADDEAVRFLQIEVELMARDAKVIEAAKTHTPRIRNALLLLLAQQHSHELATREAKEALQKQALAEVRKALTEENEPAEVGAVYFTSFVIQ
jgi:flagellar FliL protein